MRLLPIFSVLVVSLTLVVALPVALGASGEASLQPSSSASSINQPAQTQADQASFSQDTPPDIPAPELTPDGWEIIVPGIDYREFQFPGPNEYDLPYPNNVFVARMELANQDVILESSIAQGRLASGTESVTGMANRYDQTINYWGGEWGARSKVVIAINGYYFDPSNGYPHRGQIHSTWYAKRFDDLENGSGFVWNTDRSVYMGECIRHATDKQFVTFPKSGTTQLIQGVNAPRGDDQLILYTPQYDAGTNTGDDPKSVEAIVELSKPASLLKAADMITGTVQSIRKNIGSAPIPFDHIVLSAEGSARDLLLDGDKNDLNEGDVIGITQKITNCDNSLPFEWNTTYASIGGHFYFLKDGNVQHYPDNTGATSRHPRTAIAFNDQYVFYIVVDGRDPYASIGMTSDELAVFAKEVLKATHGVSEDGGGSSTMVVNGEVKNNTFCNNVFCKSKVFIPVVSQSGASKSSVSSRNDGPQAPFLIPSPPFDPDDGSGVEGDNGILEFDATTGAFQRWVANGMLMVVVEPITKTITFAHGSSLTTYTKADLRLGPGANYGKLATLDPGTSGEVVDHSHDLNGLLATGDNWWKVDFGGLVGWMTEQSLTPPTLSSLSRSTIWIYR